MSSAQLPKFARVHSLLDAGSVAGEGVKRPALRTAAYASCCARMMVLVTRPTILNLTVCSIVSALGSDTAVHRGRPQQGRDLGHRPAPPAPLCQQTGSEASGAAG